MELTYLGTGGGGGVPEMFCSCRVCEHARQFGGRDIRTRSQAILDGIISIDCPVDTFLHTLHSGLDMRKIRHFLITHNHFDHFLHQNFAGRPQGTTGPARVYMSEGSSGMLKRDIDNKKEAERTGRVIRTSEFEIELHLVRAFETFEISGYEVTPLEAHHPQNVEPLVYLIRREGKAMLWAHDTGPLTEATTAYLSKTEGVLDFVSLDCTLGRGQILTEHHMDLDQCLETVAFLEREGLYKRDHTHVFLSHLGHLGGLTHQEQADEAGSYGLEVAYDGLSVTF